MRDYVLRVRMNQDEMGRLFELASDYGLSLADTVRFLVRAGNSENHQGKMRDSASEPPSPERARFIDQDFGA